MSRLAGLTEGNERRIPEASRAPLIEMHPLRRPGTPDAR
jgi:hypothetical protein